MPEPWQIIPDDILEEEQRRTDAGAWIQQQRKELADPWAEQQRQEWKRQVEELQRQQMKMLDFGQPNVPMPAQSPVTPAPSMSSLFAPPQQSQYKLPGQTEETPPASGGDLASGLMQGLRSWQESARGRTPYLQGDLHEGDIPGGIERVLNFSNEQVAQPAAELLTRLGSRGIDQPPPEADWQGLGEAWRQRAEAFPGQKGLTEMATNPLNFIPGELFAKAGQAVVAGKPLAEAAGELGHFVPGMGIKAVDQIAQAKKYLEDEVNSLYKASDKMWHTNYDEYAGEGASSWPDEAYSKWYDAYKKYLDAKSNLEQFINDTRLATQSQAAARPARNMKDIHDFPEVAPGWYKIPRDIPIDIDESKVIAEAERNPAWQAWIADSAVGIPVYHGARGGAQARKIQEGQFTGDVRLGWHFGTIKAAQDRLEQSSRSASDAAIGQFWLKIRNPIETEDIGSGSVYNWASALKKQDIISGSKLEGLFEEYQRLHPGETDHTQQRNFIRDFLESRGYDGHVYRNSLEDPGSLSYQVFRPEQIKSTSAKEFRPTPFYMQSAPGVAGSVGGGTYGYTTAPENATDEERWARAMQYGALGGAAGLGLTAAGRVPGAIRMSGELATKATKKLPTAVESLKDPYMAAKVVTPYDTPEVLWARELTRNQPKTVYINTPERRALRNEVFNKVYGTGAINKDHQAVVVLGPPASGKSSLVAEPIARNLGALVIDNDKVMTHIPEFNAGTGANAVHLESAAIARGIFDKAVESGDNIVYPMVGKNTDLVHGIIDDLNSRGYNIHLVYMDTNIDKAAQNAVRRFQGGGRFVDPEYVLRVGDRPKATFDQLKNEVSSYAEYRNELSGPVKLIDRSGSGPTAPLGRVSSIPEAAPGNISRGSLGVPGGTLLTRPGTVGAVAGGFAGATQGNTPEERARNALIGAGAGALGAEGIARAPGAIRAAGPMAEKLAREERGQLTLPGFEPRPPSPPHPVAGETLYGPGQSTGWEHTWNRARNVISHMGQAGEELASRLHEWRNQRMAIAGDWVSRMPTVRKLTRPEFENFADVAEAKAQPLNAKVQQAFQEWNTVRDEIYNRAKAAGLDVNYLQNYFPHRFDYNQLFNAGNWPKMIDHLKETGAAATDAEAEQILYNLRDQARVRKISNLELQRKFNMPGYKRDLHALLGYTEEAADGIARAEQLGAKDITAKDLLAQMARQGWDRYRAEDLYAIATGGKERDPFWQTASGMVRASNMLTKLGLGALTNAAQSVNTATVGGGIRTLLKAPGAAISPEAHEFALKAGVILDSTIAAVQEGGGFTRRASAIGAPLFQNVERFNRTLAAVVGRDMARDALRRGDTKTLSELGLDAQSILQGGSLSQADEVRAAQNVVERTQFYVEPQDLPGWVSSPLGKIIMQFRTFGYNQTAFMGREILQPAFHGDVRPLLRFFIYGMPTGAAVMGIQDFLRQKANPDEDFRSYLTRAADRIGTLGVLGDVLRGVDPRQSGNLPGYASSVSSAVFGPSMGTFMEAAGTLPSATRGNLEPLSRFATRQIPVVGPTLKNVFMPNHAQPAASGKFDNVLRTSGRFDHVLGSIGASGKGRFDTALGTGR